MLAREKKHRSINLTCPHCGERHRTVGWLNWHIKQYHSLGDSSTSPAREREWIAHASIPVLLCLVCNRELDWKGQPETIGYLRYKPDGIDAICRYCFDRYFVSQIPETPNFPVFMKGG